MNCPICLDTLDNKNKIYTTSCNHIFHKKCIKMWFKESKKNNTLSCPYCRTTVSSSKINFKSNIKNLIYKTKNIKRKTCIINGNPVCFINKQLQDELPKAWIDSNEILRPLFKIDINIKEPIYITSFLRSYLLFANTKNNKNINLLEKTDFFGEKYYDIEDDSIITGIFTNRMFNISYDWCFQVLHGLKNEYGIFFELFYNTLLNDLSLNTMINMNMQNDKSMFQAIYTCSMYSLINKFEYNNKNNIPNIEKFIYYSYNLYTKKQLQPILDYQKNYLENNIILL